MPRYHRLKDIAAEMDLCPRQVRRWWKKLNVPPTVPSQPHHKWSERDKDTLLRRWRDYWRERQKAIDRLKKRRASGAQLSKAELSMIGTFQSSTRRG